MKQYGCCGLEYSRDRSGATTTYYRDALKRVYRTVSQRSSNGAAITTNTDFDGLTTTVTRTSDAGSLLVSETTRSLGGLTTTRKSPDADGDGNPEVSTRVIVHNAGTGSTTTNTAPDTGTTITATFLDGKTKSVSGTAVSNGGSMTYDYGTHALNGGGVYAKVTQAK